MHTSPSAPAGFLRKYAKYLPWVLLLLEYLWLVFYYYNYGQTLINADMSSEMVLADLMNQRGDFLLCQDWYYSTELRVLNVHMIYRLGLALFDSWHAARTFSIALALLLLLLCYFFFAWQARLPRRGVWAAVMMLCPFSGLYHWLFLLGLFYVPHAALSFLSLGLALGLARPGKGTWRRKLPWALSLVLLSAGAGLGGVRMLLVCYIPMALAAAALYGRRIFAASPGALAPAALHSRETAFLLACALACLGGLAGYLVNVRVLSQVYSFSSFNSTSLTPFSLESFLHIYGNLSTLFHYQPGAEALSIAGIQSLAAVAWLVLLPLGLTVGLCRCKGLAFEARCALAVAAAMLGSGVAVNALSGMDDPRYLLVAVIFGFVGLATALEGYPFRNLAAKAVCVLCLAALLAAPCISPDFTMYHYDYAPGLRAASEWLRDNGYRQGYATFWNANPVTEFTDGAVEIWHFDHGIWHGEVNPLTVYAWLQRRDHMYSYPDGPVFVLLTQEEADAGPGYARADKLVYQADGYAVYAYGSAEELYGVLGIHILR